MTSTRSYRPARTAAAALAELEACAGSDFDPQVVEAAREALGARHAEAPAEEQPLPAGTLVPTPS